MKALGKIGNIELGYQQEKTSTTDGHKYWFERYTIYFESGDDIHMVTTGIHCQGQNGGLEILKRRGIEVGARGEMTIRYGFHDYNGRRFPECELIRFDSMEQALATPTQQPEAPAAVLAQGMAEAAEAADANLNQDSGLPF